MNFFHPDKMMLWRVATVKLCEICQLSECFFQKKTVSRGSNLSKTQATNHRPTHLLVDFKLHPNEEPTSIADSQGQRPNSNSNSCKP